MASKASKYENHPLADIFPMMEESDLQALAADIKINGQHESGLLYEGKILDGRNRYAACIRAGVDMEFTEHVPPDESIIGCGFFDPLAYVISHNLHRRHLTTSQRASVAANIANLKHGGDRKNDQESNCTLEESAKLLNVSVDSVKRAKTVRDKGTPELGDMVRDGKVSVDAAAKVASKPKAEQAAIVAEGAKAVKEAAKTVPKRIAKGSGVPKPVTTLPIDLTGELDHTCKRCAKYAKKSHKLLAENKQLTDALSYARGQLSEQTDAGLFPFLDKCQKFWNEADGVGKAAMHNWLDKQKIVPESEPSQKNDKDWRPARHEVVVEVTS